MGISMNRIPWMKLTPFISLVIFLPIWLVFVVLNPQGYGRNYIWIIGLIYIILWWFQSDRSDRGIQLPFDAGFLMAALWPVVFPFYLFKTRGAKAFRILLLLLVIFIMSCLLAAGIYFVIRRP